MADAKWIENESAGRTAKMYGAYMKAGGKKADPKPITVKKSPRKAPRRTSTKLTLA